MTSVNAAEVYELGSRPSSCWQLATGLEKAVYCTERVLYAIRDDHINSIQL